jgi:hypothetical protein
MQGQLPRVEHLAITKVEAGKEVFLICICRRRFHFRRFLHQPL